MQDPQGTMRYVPMEEMDAARAAGGKLIPYGSDQPTDMGVGDYIRMGWNALTQPEATGTRPGVLGNIATAVHNVGGRAASAIASGFAHPLDTLQSAAEMTPPGQVVDTLLDRPNPIQQRAQQFQADYAHDKPLAVENLAGDALGAYEGGRMAGGLLDSKPAQTAIKKVTSPLTNYANARMVPVPGENYTPQQHASFSGVLARGTGAGKGYFPKDVASSIGSAVRQAAADNPGIASAIQNGSAEDSLAGTQALLGKVRERIDTAHQQALGPVANTPIDPTSIQNAVTFPNSLKDFAPQDAAAVNDLRERLGNVRTLGGLNDLRMYINRELSSQFRQNPVAAGNSGAVTSAMQDALKATRDQYYQELENATGQSFQNAKRMESGVLSAEEALANAAPGMAARQAIAEQPRSLRGQAAEALQGAHTLGGGPIAGTAKLIAKRVLGETPMTPVQEGLRDFFNNLPLRTPLRAGAPQFSQGPTTPNPRSPIQAQPQLLPAQTLGQSVTAAPAQSLRERLANSYGADEPNQFPSPYREPATASAMPIPDRGTIAVGPDGVAQRGPAGLLPERTGIPQLTAGDGGPQFVVQPASPPPALNPATARTNVNAGRPLRQPLNRPVEPTAPTINVSPQGQATVQRALPPPETHAWSRSAWSKEHPNGNVKTAEKQARGKGYKVID
jgi:post-segregation antitoxin (ccd killing protein)